MELCMDNHCKLINFCGFIDDFFRLQTFSALSVWTQWAHHVQSLQNYVCKQILNRKYNEIVSHGGSCSLHKRT